MPTLGETNLHRLIENTALERRRKPFMPKLALGAVPFMALISFLYFFL